MKIEFLLIFSLGPKLHSTCFGKPNKIYKKSVEVLHDVDKLKKRRDEKKKKAKKQMKEVANRDAVTLKLMGRVSEEYEDVLRQIETVIVGYDISKNPIDNLVVANALRHHLYGKVMDDPPTLELIDDIQCTRDLYSNLDDKEWKDCLRVVLDSVHTHSPAIKGARGYLDFVTNFIPKDKNGEPIFYMDFNRDKNAALSHESVSALFEDEAEDTNAEATGSKRDEGEEKESHLHFSVTKAITKVKDYLGSKDKSHDPVE